MTTGKSGILAALMCLCLVVAGCTKHISKADFDQLRKEQLVNSELWFWYTGLDASYHYFKSDYSGLIENSYKLPKSALVIGKEFPHTSDKSKWVQVPIGGGRF